MKMKQNKKQYVKVAACVCAYRLQSYQSSPVTIPLLIDVFVARRSYTPAVRHGQIRGFGIWELSGFIDLDGLDIEPSCRGFPEWSDRALRRRGQPRLFSGRWSRRVNPSTIFTTSDLTLYFLTATGVSSLWTFYMESSARDCVGSVSSLRDIFVEISLMMENFGLCSRPMQCIRACYHRYHRSLSF